MTNEEAYDEQFWDDEQFWIYAAREEKRMTNADLISRRVAIKAIEDLQDCYNGFSDTFDKACIIGVLEELPSVQTEQPSEIQLIDTDAEETVVHCNNKENAKTIAKILDVDSTGHYFELIKDSKSSDAYFEKLIYASDLIEWIMETYSDWCVAPVRGIVDYVEALPSAQPEQRWIPCSERLPEVHEEPYYADYEEILHESDHVLTCCKDGKGFVYAIGTVIHDEMCDSYEWSDLYDYAGCVIDDMQVLAWMPLPEPWKGEEE